MESSFQEILNSVHSSTSFERGEVTDDEQTNPSTSILHDQSPHQNVYAEIEPHDFVNRETLETIVQDHKRKMEHDEDQSAAKKVFNALSKNVTDQCDDAQLSTAQTSTPSVHRIPICRLDDKADKAEVEAFIGSNGRDHEEIIESQGHVNRPPPLSNGNLSCPLRDVNGRSTSDTTTTTTTRTKLTESNHPPTTNETRTSTSSTKATSTRPIDNAPSSLKMNEMYENLVHANNIAKSSSTKGKKVSRQSSPKTLETSMVNRFKIDSLISTPAHPVSPRPSSPSPQTQTNPFANPFLLSTPAQAPPDQESHQNQNRPGSPHMQQMTNDPFLTSLRTGVQFSAGIYAGAPPPAGQPPNVETNGHRSNNNNMNNRNRDANINSPTTKRRIITDQEREVLKAKLQSMIANPIFPELVEIVEGVSRKSIINNNNNRNKKKLN